MYICAHTYILHSVYVYIYKYTRRLPHYLIYHSPLSCPERHINLSRYYMCLFGRLILRKRTLLHIKVYLMKLFLCTALNSKLKKVYGSYRARIFSFSSSFFFFFFFVQTRSKNKCDLSRLRRCLVCSYINYF